MSSKLKALAETITAIVAVVGAIAVFFTYAHATFMTRSEASEVKYFRDKEAQTVLDKLNRIEKNLDTLMLDRHLRYEK